jgi:hypothetical protein
LACRIEQTLRRRSAQNALPVWYTHSTVTGSATSLGLTNKGASASGPLAVDRSETHDDDLARHYARLEEEENVKREQGAAEGEPVFAVPMKVEQTLERKNVKVEIDLEDGGGIASVGGDIGVGAGSGGGLAVVDDDEEMEDKSVGQVDIGDDEEAEGSKMVSGKSLFDLGPSADGSSR